MKKQLHFISYFALAVLCTVVSWDTLYAQQTNPDAQQPPSQTQPNTQGPPSGTPPEQPPSRTSPDTQARPSDAAGAQVFTGTVVQQGNKYVLQADNGTTYDIDLQDQVKKFEGKRVRVHGTLDPSGKMIHVQ